jgi:uncharacterized protein YjdB
MRNKAAYAFPALFLEFVVSLFALSFAMSFLASCAGTPRNTVTRTSVSINPKDATLFIGGPFLVLGAKVSSEFGVVSAVLWSTSDPAVATVDQTGQVTAVAVGTAVVVATADGVSATCAIRVEKPVTSVTVDSLEQLYYSSLGIYDAFVTVNYTIVNSGKIPITSCTITFQATCEDGSTYSGTGKATSFTAGASGKFTTFIDVRSKHVTSVTVVDQAISYK